MTREFARLQPTERGVVALRKAVDAARELEVNLENEPRLKSGKSAEALKADHPFFWSGHMLLEIPRTPREADAVQDAAKADAAAKVDDGANADENVGDAKADDAKADAKANENGAAEKVDPLVPAPLPGESGSEAKGSGTKGSGTKEGSGSK